MMNMKLIGTLTCIWLVMAIAATAQNPVLDTAGQPLRRGLQYYIKPAITDNGGRFTLISRNDSCPLYPGQENFSGGNGAPVTFAPFVRGENVVRETKNFKVRFDVFTICLQSTTWRVGQEDPETGRRLIETGDNGGFGNYFYIRRGKVENTYEIRWCPAELCPTCRFRCGDVGALVENDKRLLALDGSVLPVVFERA
ncbi:hypothetical protein TIFTF001_034907 [Ficus carica]|uniref:Uncharacterized protein n=1 Tax=Ficus carica TaxID=3494 RepID=A0AA88E289_FICCA|nr:hypothetical protein TIFTF001_034907 [Ficus carica]